MVEDKILVFSLMQIAKDTTTTAAGEKESIFYKLLTATILEAYFHYGY